MVDAGVEWPALVAALVERQQGRARQWGIAQKQTGADRLTIGGALSANAHGRGLQMAPFVGDVESFDLVDAAGALRRCSRTENRELFQLAIGGYGLFGVVTSVTLRLVPRRKVRRLVDVRPVDGLMEAFDRRIAEGFLYGDFQYDDRRRRGYLHAPRRVLVLPAGRQFDADRGGAEGALGRRVARTAASGACRPLGAFDRYSSYYLSTPDRSTGPISIS